MTDPRRNLPGIDVLLASDPVRPLLDAFPRGRVVVLAGRCKGCELCIEYCPQKMLDWSADYNAKGYRYPVIVPGMEQACVACGYCQSVCPDFAIYVEMLPLPEGGA